MSRNEFLCDCNVLHQESVDKARKKMKNEKIFKELATFYKLIGDETRCKILFAINEHEMCVCDIANSLNMTKSSISHQLSKLRENSIVKCEKRGKEVYYTLDDDHVHKVFEIGLEHINHRIEENL